MSCDNCGADLVDRARYCPRCGADAIASDRPRGYAVHPGESITSFNVVTSLLPLASGSAPQTYRWALAAGLAVPAILGVLGYLPMAFAAAAVVVPAVYLVYLDDVNEWEDQPTRVLADAVALSVVLGLVFTLFWQELLLADGAGALVRSVDFEVQLRDLLVVGVVVPLGALALAQIGPLWLAATTQFDDLLDGLSFGIVSGASFAAAETLVVNRGLFLDGSSHIDDPDAALWLSLLVTAALLKPVVYGATVGLAVAGFSGLGSGHDGFGPGYARAAAEAAVAMVAFGTGLYLFGQVAGNGGAVLACLWAVVVAAGLLVRVRHVLHHALLEASLEDEQAGRDRGAVCPACELPLTGGALSASCGTAVRAGSKRVRGPTVPVVAGEAST